MQYPDMREYITFTDARPVLCCHLFGHWHPRVATRNANECALQLTHAKHHTSKPSFDRKLMIYETPSVIYVNFYDFRL